MTAAGYAVVGLALLSAAAAMFWSWWRLKTTMERMDKMLTAVMNGTFSEGEINESRLSAIEGRLARYLTASVVSERNLQAQKDRISTLIADVSHQTRTPVTNLRLYASLIAEEPLTPKGRECARAISTQAEKLQILMEALVKTSRLETGILTLHPRRQSIAPVVERAAAQYLPAASDKEISLTVSETEGEAEFDPKWTEEAVCNLIDNAIKYTPAGGKVMVEVRNYELFAAICVSDTGPGLSEEEQAKVFGRFYRGPAAYQKAGVGIGLYLTRQIAAGQGGYVKVKSTPGQGSTFSLYLPRSEIRKGG